MLKSARQAKNLTHLRFGLSASHIPKRSLYAKHLYHEDQNEHQARKMEIDDLKVKSFGGAGIVYMNKEHRFNILTPHLASQVSRGVRSMDMDHSVEVICLTPREGNQFSNGTDFKTLLYLRQNEGEEKAA